MGKNYGIIEVHSYGGTYLCIINAQQNFNEYIERSVQIVTTFDNEDRMSESLF